MFHIDADQLALIKNYWPFIVVFFAIEIALVVFAIMRVVKTPKDEVRLGYKLVWILVSLFFSTIGPIITIIFVRVPKEVSSIAETSKESIEDVANLLYADQNKAQPITEKSVKSAHVDSKPGE